MNRLWAYIYPLLFAPTPPIISPTCHPSRSSQSTELSNLCYTAGFSWLVISHVVAFMSVLLSQFILPSPSPTTNKRKRKPPEWEQMSANKTMRKGLISKIYKYLVEFNIKKQTTQTKSRQKPKQTKTKPGCLSPKTYSWPRDT